MQRNNPHLVSQKQLLNKKVLLRERKRHTAHPVASARYAALSNGWMGGGGYPIQSWWGVSPSRPGQGVGTPGTPPPPTIQTWPPHPQTWDRVPPFPASVDRLKILPSLILRMRVVTTNSKTHIVTNKYWRLANRRLPITTIYIKPTAILCLHSPIHKLDSDTQDSTY